MLRRDGRLRPYRAIDVCRQVASALDAAHAGRVSDLTLYLRQHHAERDEVSLGRTLLAGDRPW